MDTLLTDFVWSDIATLSPCALLAMLLMGLGVVLKRSPVEDWLIPFILIGLGALLYPFIADVTEIARGVKHPGIYRVVVGATIGTVSVGTHGTFRQFLRRKGDDGTTKFYRK